MKKILTIILVAISFSSFAQDTFNLNVEITNFRNSKGTVLIQVFNKDKEIVKTLEAKIMDKKSNFSIANLKKGEYAIRYYHDENNNKELDFNWMGVPKEGYGYSNNAKAMFSEPEFKDWLFQLDKNKILNLECYYIF